MPALTLNDCREIAARIWCDPAFQHVVMNVELAEKIAEQLLLEAASQNR